ncbi:hypothetical protein NDA13_001150 [Ustilago tritici]|nr:hypothetical protein NDA13_001150 [Ustilago tritici]
MTRPEAAVSASTSASKVEEANNTASQQQPALSTPPTSSAALPTPPTSHNHFRPPPNPVASSSPLATDERLPDASPTTTVSDNMAPRRAAARLSAGSSSFADHSFADHSFSSQRRLSRRSSIDHNDQRTFAAERPLDRTSYRSCTTHSPTHSPAPSPTPSPILGPVFADLAPLSSSSRLDRDDDDDDADHHNLLKLGHLSFPMLGVAVGPTKHEIQMLVYGSTSANADSNDLPSPSEESGSVESILGSLANMGIDPATETSASERERQLAGMVKLVASRCNTLAQSRDRAQSQLKSTRLTALSVISSIKQAHAHALAAHRNTTDRLEAELDGWKAQAKMLSALLNRAEARAFDERRSISSSSAPLVAFADKAKAAASGTSPSSNRVASFNSQGTASNTDSHQPLLSSPSFLSSANENGPSDRSPGTTGLGITTSSLAEVDTDLSPTASLIRQRNKLITDKKHLKSRVRDAEAQIYRLENELKALRPYLVSGAIKVADLTADASAAEPIASQTLGALSQPGTAPTTPICRSDKNRKKRNATMGDAETEHLMLAARRLRELRKEQAAAAAAVASGSAAHSSSLTASQDSAKQPSNGTALAPAPQLSASSAMHASPVKRQASPGPMTGERDAPYSAQPRTPPSRSAERPPKTPKSIASNQHTPRTGLRARELDQLARGDDRRDSWSGRHRRLDSASSFTGIDELLQAAETLNPGAAAPSPTRGPAPPFPPPAGDPTYYPRELPHRGINYPPPLSVTTQRGPSEYDSYGYSAGPFPIQSSPLHMVHESPKRRRVSCAAFDFEAYDSPFLGDRQPRNRTQTEGADPLMQGCPPYYDHVPSGPPSAGGSQTLSALDVLADQATASQNPSQGSDKSGEYEGVSPIGSLSSEDEMTMHGDSRRKSRLVSSRNPDGSRSCKTNGSQGSRNGESKSFGGNQNPEKRLPYVRWTAEEDTKLRAAIKEHGQRWELISRAVGTRSYHQCRQRYLLMRRKEAAAKASQNEDGGQALSASASDQGQSQDSDYGRDPPHSTGLNSKSGSHGRRTSSGGGGEREKGFGQEGVTSTPLHKLSTGAPAPAGSVYGQFSPTTRQQDVLGPPSSQTPTHNRILSHPGPGPLSPSMQPSSPFSSQTPAVRRGHYPPPSPLNASSRQLPPLQPQSLGYVSHGPPSSPYASAEGGHGRQFSGGDATLSYRHQQQQQQQQQLQGRGGAGSSHPPTSPTTPTCTEARRMGAALYS